MSKKITDKYFLENGFDECFASDSKWVFPKNRNEREKYQIIDWKFISKNELPEKNKKVLCVLENGTYEIGYHQESDPKFRFVNNSEVYFICEKWCELPK